MSGTPRAASPEPGAGAVSTYAELLAAFAVAARDRLPAAVQHDAGQRIVDVVGNAVAAAASAGPTEPHNAINRLVQARGGAGEAMSLIGTKPIPADAAALVNGTLAHALDFDDTHLPSVLHPSAAIVPAALAMAEARGASGGELLAAVAVGDEICNRLGMAAYVPRLRNSVFFVKGLHATSICGTIGAAAASAMLLGLDEPGICSAMGIAASMGAGIIEANRTGGTVKRIHCGWAAHAGVEAALFAEAGITGPPTVFEGTFGFLQAYLGEERDDHQLVDELGSRWELLRTVYKPYPSNHFTHPIVDCALALRADGLKPEQIADVEIGVAATVLRTIAEPREQKIHPRSPYHAKFSGPYVFAAAILGGGGLGVGLEDFTDAALADTRRLAIAERCTLVADPICDEEFPLAFSAIVRVRTTAGLTVQRRVHSSRGGPDSPLTDEELEAKFRLNAGQYLDRGGVEALLIRLAAIPTTDRMQPLLG